MWAFVKFAPRAWSEDSPVASARQLRPVTIAVVTVSLLAGVDALSGPGVVLAGLLAVGPCLAAVSSRPREVLVVAGYVLVLINVLAWWPDQIWGTLHQLFYVLATAGVTAVSVGIAQRLRRLEETASRLEDRRSALARVVDESDDAFIGTTLDGMVTVWSAGAERMFGYSATEVIGSPAAAIAVPGSGPDRTALAARIATGERGIRYNTQALRKDGSLVEVAVTVSPVFGSDATVVGISRAVRDLTATKQAEAGQRTAEKRFEQAQRMASLGQLAGGVAHDFNNLLTVISSFTEFAAEQTAGDEAVQADLDRVRVAAERAAGLTRQLLTFTRQDTIQPVILDINAAIAEAQAMLTRTIGEHIELITVPSPTALMISADPGKLQQILVNLAVNARDAMPGGGTLVVEASAVELDEHQESLQPAPAGGSYVRLVVSDTGVGMSADTAQRIFEPFYTTKPIGQGTGLGLATVYGIVTDAGGSINVYSEPGVGTTFRVYFPVAGAEAEGVTQPENASAPRGQDQVILVVEDDPDLRQVVLRILTSGGYRVLSAAGGSEALAVHAEQGCDLLLTDVVMPEISGRQLADRLSQSHPELPVLYMSGYTNGMLGATRILDPGIAFIEKPFTAKVLLAEVNHALAGARGKAGKVSRA
jgi:PAS domain S-box-containing protein